MKAITGLFLTLFSYAAIAAEPVTIDTFVRAQTDTSFRNTIQMAGGVGKLAHLRAPQSADSQPVIRMNRDTLYSAIIVDLSKPVTVVLPDTNGRYLSLHVINQDHYMFVITDSGRHMLSMDNVGTRYAGLSFRTFADPHDSEDLAKVHALQDSIVIEGATTGPYEAPDWDLKQLETIRSALNSIAKLGMDSGRAFGRQQDVDTLQYLIGTAAGWGGLPEKNAIYDLERVDNNDGSPYAVTVGDVPVNAFWSITVYNSEGYFEKNDRDTYSYNDITANPNSDGSYTIHFGGCEDQRGNCLPITDGWNYAVRMYEPKQEIRDGTWVFPTPEPIK